MSDDIDEAKMKACFADNADLPIACAADIGEEYNCLHLMSGETKASCPHWSPKRTRELCKDLLGYPEEHWGTIRF